MLVFRGSRFHPRFAHSLLFVATLTGLEPVPPPMSFLKSASLGASSAWLTLTRGSYWPGVPGLLHHPPHSGIVERPGQVDFYNLAGRQVARRPFPFGFVPPKIRPASKQAISGRTAPP